MGVVDLAHRAQLGQEALALVAALQELGRDDLEGHVHVDLQVVRPVDRADRPHAQHAADLVALGQLGAVAQAARRGLAAGALGLEHRLRGILGRPALLVELLAALATELAAIGVVAATAKAKHGVLLRQMGPSRGGPCVSRQTTARPVRTTDRDVPQGDLGLRHAFAFPFGLVGLDRRRSSHLNTRAPACAVRAVGGPPARRHPLDPVWQRSPEGLGLLLALAFPSKRPRLLRFALSYFPVCPKPPWPRWVSSSAWASSRTAWTTGAITSWAMRSPRAMRAGCSPRLARMTWTSPR